MASQDTETDEAIREEFLAEAQEIVESLSRDLLILDQGAGDGTVDLINDLFRGVHTLKGMAGMFGFDQVGTVAHSLENLLDELRLGRVSVGKDVLDVLFEGVEQFQRLLSPDKRDRSSEIDAYANTITRIAMSSPNQGHPLDVYAIDPKVLSVLTEYEEHRLRTNIREDIPLYRLEVSYPLSTIDVALEELKARAKPPGEIITYLPTVGEGDDDRIELEVLLASRKDQDQLIQELARHGGKLLPVPMAEQLPTEPPAPPSTDTLPPEDNTPLVMGPSDTLAGEIVSLVEAAEDAPSFRLHGHTVRVDIRKLDHLMHLVGELALLRGSLEQMADRFRRRPELRSVAGELHRVNRYFERNLRDLQGGILGVRMVPLGQLFDRVARGVRQVAKEREKEISFVVTGAETELDKLLVEELSDPLMHLVRNCVDHGIERPQRREIAGKGRVGTLAVNAYQKGHHVVIEIEDDGAGIDTDRVAQVAVRRALIAESAPDEMSREEKLALIFLPGFSTLDEVTDTSGRGVGMDVVKTNIARLGGVVDVQSERGTGTKFTITLPITLAIIRALVVSVRDEVFTVPLTAVREALSYDPAMVHSVDGRSVISLRGVTLPLCFLGDLFDLAGEPSPRQFVVVVEAGTRSLGIVVDGLSGQKDVVIKAFGESLSRIRGFAGASDLGSGGVALVLDIPGLVEEVLTPTDHALLKEASG
ncbi:MAG: chemotaxis protein CheA [Myxococcales bacterium]|nr:chemotaxis protein CheA [Myxococcales bacterium]